MPQSNRRGRRKRLYGCALALLALLYVHELGYHRRAFQPNEEDDRAVLLAAMDNLARWSVSAQIRGGERGPILLADHSSQVGRSVPLLTLGSWPRLFQLDASLRSRNREQTLLAWDSTERIHLGTEEELWRIAWEHKPSLYRCVAFTTLPGYSRDGRFAVLRTRVGPTAHGSRLTFLLRRSGPPGSPWEVLWREAIFYA